VSYSNCPTPPTKLPDMCETCESFNDGRKLGLHTFLAIDRGYRLSEGLCL
jgi:hypothetical protein